MKRYIIPFLILTVISFTGLGLAWWYIQSLSDDITITETVLTGDKKVAKGISITTKSHYEETPLFWETTYTVGKDTPETATSFTFNKKRELEPDDSFEKNWLSIDSVSWKAWSDTSDLTADHEYACLFENALIKAGEKYEETLFLRDYMPYFPASLDWSFSFDDKEVSFSNENVAEYFQFPIPDDYLVQITVEKEGEQDDRTHRLEMDAKLVNPVVSGTVSKDMRHVFIGLTDLYMEDIDEAEEVKHISMPLQKESYGIHYFPAVVTKDNGYSHSYSGEIVAEKGKCIYPLKKGTTILSMDFSKDGKDFLLFTLEDTQVVLTVLDGETFSLKQRLPLYQYDNPITSEDWLANSEAENFSISDHGSYIFMASIDTTISLITKNNTGYRIVFSDSHSMENLGIWFCNFDFEIFYDDKKLVFTSPAEKYSRTADSYSLGVGASSMILVYEEGILTYAGFYENSLDYASLKTWSTDNPAIESCKVTIIMSPVPASLEKSEP